MVARGVAGSTALQPSAGMPLQAAISRPASSGQLLNDYLMYSNHTASSVRNQYY